MEVGFLKFEDGSRMLDDGRTVLYHACDKKGNDCANEIE